MVYCHLVLNLKEEDLVIDLQRVFDLFLQLTILVVIFV